MIWTSVFILFQVTLIDVGGDAWRGFCVLVGLFAAMRIGYCVRAWADDRDELRRLR